MSEQKTEWGPFGWGKWRGHASVYCKVCGWPVYHMWIDQNNEPPGDCECGKSDARSCPSVMARLMQSAWVREACGGKEPHAATEMLRKCTGLTWPEIEALSDASGLGSVTIAQMRKERSARPQGEGE